MEVKTKKNVKIEDPKTDRPHVIYNEIEGHIKKSGSLYNKLTSGAL